MTPIIMFGSSKSSRTFLIVLVITLVWIYTYLNGVLDTKSTAWLKSPHRRAFINLTENQQLNSNEIQELAREIEGENELQRIYNVEKFGPINETTSVLVIQVHSRTEYLRLLIQSLSRVRNIENSLLIFSHDLYLPQLNDVVRSINFTRVMQIFFPYSIQLHPDSFPGQSPDDCPPDILPDKAKQIKCRNADQLDVRGRYREARYPQIKHHWWWKANFVFGKIATLRNHTGVVAFLEEDHYVTPDVLWVLDLLETSMIQNLCHGCDLLALGFYVNTWNISMANSRGVVTNWEHNMGMAFNRTVWNEIKRCAPTFCDYDDYNWDWSLLQVSTTCLHRPMIVIYAEAPRIFHIGDCGVHHKPKKCNPHAGAKTINQDMKTYRALLFPNKLAIQVRMGKPLQPKKGNGNWGDIRDKQLCLSFSKETNKTQERKL